MDTIADRWRLVELVVRSLRDGIGVVDRSRELSLYCKSGSEDGRSWVEVGATWAMLGEVLVGEDGVVGYCEGFWQL